MAGSDTSQRGLARRGTPSPESRSLTQLGTQRFYEYHWPASLHDLRNSLWSPGARRHRNAGFPGSPACGQRGFEAAEVLRRLECAFSLCVVSGCGLRSPLSYARRALRVGLTVWAPSSGIPEVFDVVCAFCEKSEVSRVSVSTLSEAVLSQSVTVAHSGSGVM